MHRTKEDQLIKEHARRLSGLSEDGRRQAFEELLLIALTAESIGLRDRNEVEECIEDRKEEGRMERQTVSYWRLQESIPYCKHSGDPLYLIPREGEDA